MSSNISISGQILVIMCIKSGKMYFRRGDVRNFRYLTHLGPITSTAECSHFVVCPYVNVSIRTHVLLFESAVVRYRSSALSFDSVESCGMFSNEFVFLLLKLTT